MGTFECKLQEKGDKMEILYDRHEDDNLDIVAVQAMEEKTTLEIINAIVKASNEKEKHACQK